MRDSTLTYPKVLLIGIFKCTQPFLILGSSRGADQQDGPKQPGHPTGLLQRGRHPWASQEAGEPRKEIWKVNSGGEIRPGGCSSLRLIYPARITMQFERTNGRCEDLAVELLFHCRISLHFAPSWLGGFTRLGRGASAPQTEGMSVGGGSREPRRNPCNYFPRSFTISKKYPDLGENISRVPGVGWGGGRGLDGDTEDQNKFPTAAKGEAGQAAAPGRPSRIAPDSEDSRLPFKVSLRRSLHSDFDINKSSPPTGSKKVPASMGEPTASSEQSREGRAGRASRRGGGEGRGGPAGRGARHAGTCGAAPAGPPRALRLRPRSRLSPPLALAWTKFHHGSPVFCLRWLAGANHRTPPEEAATAAAAAATAASFSAALGSGRSSGVAGRGRGAAGRRT